MFNAWELSFEEGKEDNGDNYHLTLTSTIRLRRLAVFYRGFFYNE